MSETIAFTGEMTINQLPEIFHNLEDAVKRRGDLVVDVSKVERIDAAGVQMIIAAQKECEKNGNRVILKKSDAVTDMLSLIVIQL